MIGPKVKHDSRSISIVHYLIGWFWMKITGWDVTGNFPGGGKCVLIAAPHTSNWDLVYLIAAGFVFRAKISWLGKDAIFKKPFGTIMRWLGGIPVDRSAPNGLVAQVVQKYNESDKLIITVPPSGSRGKMDHWKSGFYWIAKDAGVPLCCGYLDYRRKVACLGLSFVPTGEVKKDMDRIRDFYKDIEGKYPENTSAMRLKEEG